MMGKVEVILSLTFLGLIGPTMSGSIPFRDQKPLSSSAISKISPFLFDQLYKHSTATVLISFHRGTAGVLEAVQDTRFSTRNDKLAHLKFALRMNADQTQKNVTEFLQGIGRLQFQSFWITNHMVVHDADMNLVYMLAEFDEVKLLDEDPLIELDVIPTESTPFQRIDSVEWNIDKVRAIDARNLLKNLSDSDGSRLSKVIVASIDTGVRATHEALRENFLGEFGWFDPYDNTQIPSDSSGHGSHTMGTICGKNGIGVFPDVSWMTCKGCNGPSCSSSNIISCAQFFICPTTPDGQVDDCTKAPQVVSNSYSSPRGASIFDNMVEAWHTAGIIPVFSIGNSGPLCESSRSPGDRRVIGVGSTTVDDSLSGFSSRGPGSFGQIKPDISAPGSSIVSSWLSGDDVYQIISGTSMACPHVSGLIAMMLSYNPELTFEDVLDVLNGGAQHGLQPSDYVCDGVEDTEFPNHSYGEGRIDALASLQYLVERSR